MTKAIPMRSWLFAPGDSERKMSKSIASDADIALLDLEDSVVPDRKALARGMVAEAIAGAPDQHRVWVRVNPLSGGETEADLDAILSAGSGSGPGGVFLPKAEGGHDIETLDALMAAREEAAGIAVGSTKVAALVTETAAAMFTTGTYDSTLAAQSRLVAMSWGAEDLSSELGAREQRGPDGEYSHVFEMARSLCLVGAVKAGVAPIETVQPEFRDLACARVPRNAGHPPCPSRPDQRGLYAKRRRTRSRPRRGSGLCRQS